MNPPSRPPIYCDAIGGTELPLERAAGWLVDDLASIVRTFPHWRNDDSGTAIVLRLLAHEPEKRTVIGWHGGAATGTLTATPDPSGWLLLVAEHGGREAFRAYVERQYEEYECWPAGSTAPRQADEPGRIGKHQTWVSLSAAAWPGLTPVANALGWLSLAIDDTKLQQRDA